MMAAAAILGAPHKADAQETTVTITGTVQSGTDNTGYFTSPGGSLAGMPFTLTYEFNAGGTITTNPCTGGATNGYSADQNTPTSNPGTGSLQIGGNTFLIGGHVGEITSGAYSFALQYASCFASSVGYGVGVSYGGGQYGGSSVFGNATAPSIYPATGHVFTTSADWAAPITAAATDGAHSFNFNINFLTLPSGPNVVVSGVLTPLILTVAGTSLDQNAETNGDPKNTSEPSNPAAPITMDPNCSCTGGVGNSGSSLVGDPINVATGNVYHTFTDYATGGANPLAFTRYYNSMGSNISIAGVAIVSQASELGSNWRSNFDRYLQITSGTTVAAERPDGQVLPFTLSGGVWTSRSDTDIKLVQSGTTWTLTDHNDTVETYTTAAGGAFAQLNSIKLRNGYTQNMTYTGGLLTSVTDSPYGRSLTLGYSGGLLQTLLTQDGTTISYGYTPVGTGNILSSVSYPTTPASSFSYQYTNPSFPTALTAIIDGAGQTYTSFGYDSAGRGNSSQNGSGANLTTLTFNGGNTVVTNAFGVADTYTYTVVQGVPKLTAINRAATSTTAAASSFFGYDGNGYMASKTDWNGIATTIVNDAHGQPTSITEAATKPIARTTTISYDPTFIHEPHQIVTTGLTSTFVYDTHGNPLSRTDLDTTTNSIPYSTNGQSRLTQWTWTTSGELKSVQLPRTDVVAKTTFTYAANGAVTQIQDALGHLTKITSRTAGGRPLTIIDVNNVTEKLTYDGGQRVLTDTLTTVAGSLKTTWTYDAARNLASLKLPDNSKLTYGYDTAHRLTSITDLLGNTTTLTPDALGDITQTVVTNASSVVTLSRSATFDALGRMLTDVGGMSQTTSFTYDKNGNMLTILPPSPSGTVTFTYDALNRLATRVEPPPGGGATWTYDAHDRMLTVKDGQTHTTSYVYDGFGDRTQAGSPDAGTSVFYYDPDRNLTQRVQPGPLTMNATFDANDRMLTRSYVGDATLSVSNTYDQTTGHGFGVGRLTSATDQIGGLSLTYDERGNVTAESRTPTGLTALNTAWGYDNAGNVSSETYPSGTVVAYTRNSMGQVTAVKATPSGGALTNVATSIAYEPLPGFAAQGAPPVTALTFGNGVTVANGYDLDYRPTTRVDTGTAGAVQNLAYGYYANNSVNTITDAVNAANTQTLGYDTYDRLTSAVSGTGGYGTFGFTWDIVDNLATETINGTTTTFTLNIGNNQLGSFKTGSVTENIAYAPTGNMTTFKIGSSTLETLGYNNANQLSSASTPTTSASYAFDEFGKRLKEVGSATATSTFQYDDSKGMGPGTNLLTDTDGAGTSRVDHIYLGNTPIGTYQPSNNKFYFISTDRLGTPGAVTDPAQAIAWSATYQPFGYTATGVSGIVQNLRLPGQEWDLESTLNHNGFRDYATTLTRYVEADPIGINGGTNVNIYQYAGGNAFKYTDRKGLESEITQNDIYKYSGYAASAAGTAAFMIEDPFALAYFGFAAVMDAAQSVNNPAVQTGIGQIGDACIDKAFDGFGPNGVAMGWALRSLFDLSMDQIFSAYGNTHSRTPTSMPLRPSTSTLTSQYLSTLPSNK